MTSRLFAIGLVVLTSLAGARRAEACAGCRNPSLTAKRGSEGPLPAQALRLGASLTGTTVHVVHEAGCADLAACSEVPVQPLYLHDQYLYPVELRLVAEYGFTTNVGVELQFPMRAVTTRIEYTTPDGAPYEPLDPGVHHRDETVAGPADPWLLLRVGTTVEGWWLAARPGVSLPLGKTEEDPFALGDQGIRHQHIQLGSGTFDPVLVLEASRPLDGWQFDAFAQGSAALYENRHGYQAPWRIYGGVALGRELVEKLTGSLGLEAFHEAEERWGGVVRQDGNLGRTELLAAGALRLALGTTVLDLGLRVPFYRHIVEGSEKPGELSSPLTLSLGVTHVFGAAPETGG